MSRYQPFKQQVADTARYLTEKGYLMATGGNLSDAIVAQMLKAAVVTNRP